MFRLRAVGAFCLFISFITINALAQTPLPTGYTGGNQPHFTIQPSMGMNWLIRYSGDTDRLGELMLFGGDTPPAGWTYANGALLPISAFPDLYAKLGSAYGGNGTNTFAFPDLRGRTAIGIGGGFGDPQYNLGDRIGAEQVTLSVPNLPAHAHMIAGEGPTHATGESAPYSNMQPGLGLNHRIALQGAVPQETGPMAGGTMMGEVRLSASGHVPAGWVQTLGQQMPIHQFQDLYSLLNTNYGGDGRLTFALPDLEGRGAVQAGTGQGLTEQELGQMSGFESVSLLQSQMPSHAHLHSDPEKFPHVFTGPSGGDQPQDNMQPTMALNYIIALDGVMPDPTGPVNETARYVGEIALFAGDFAPAGWALLDGQTLQRSQHPELFNVIGNTYGGDGISEFALPDLRGRLPVGMGDGQGLLPWMRGQQRGAETVTLTVQQMPLHNHTVPEPGVMGILAAAGLFLTRRRSL